MYFVEKPFSFETTEIDWVQTVKFSVQAGFSTLISMLCFLYFVQSMYTASRLKAHMKIAQDPLSKKPAHYSGI